MFWYQLFIVTFILSDVHSALISGDQPCASSCPDGSKFGWQQSRRYVYHYHGDSLTVIRGTPHDHSSIHVIATVTIDIITRCEFTMQLTNVDLRDSKPDDFNDRSSVPMAEMFNQALQQNVLRFGFMDGEIERVCPEPTEEPWVLNIKRAILSHFQNTMPYLYASTVTTNETDIYGTCSVTYTSTLRGGNVNVKKTKDIQECEGGKSFDSLLKGTSYNFASFIQTLPLMKSMSDCEQIFDSNNILIKVMCNETHLFRPFSEEDNGATTLITSNIRFIYDRDSTQDLRDTVYSRASLIFDTNLPSKEKTSALRDSVDILHEICQNMNEDVRPDTPAIFYKLLREMRHLDDDNLLHLYRQTDAICYRAREFFRDAVPLVKHNSSLLLILALHESNEIMNSEAEYWLTALAMTSKPSLQLIRQSSSLLSINGPFLQKATLAISILVNSYCNDNTNCRTITEIIDIINKFEYQLNYDCSGDHDRVMLALKAIGNTGVGGKITTVLARCVQNNNITVDVRIAAMKAFRKLPCNSDENTFEILYSDMSLESELRINAFINLMRCPTTYVIGQIKQVLMNEEVNNVGTFVWSFLSNFAKTTSSNQEIVTYILAQEELASRFDSEANYLSRNRKLSYFNQIVESNIIWLENSFIPRSVNLNLTISIFGKLFNLMELEGRLENAEQMLETILGKNNAKFNIQESNEFQASYSLKILGNELIYDFQNLNYLDWLSKLAQGNEIELTKSLMFLESTMVIPTCMGLPLNLRAGLSTTLNIKLNVKLDITRISWPLTMEIDGKFEPSGAFKMETDMGVDARYAHSGLQVITTIHSSSIVKSSIKVSDGQIVKVKLDMPRDKIEIISFRSDFLIHHRNDRIRQMNRLLSLKRYECMDFTRALGIDACMGFETPHSSYTDKPWLFLQGPIEAGVVINKKDIHEEYSMEIIFKKETTEQENSLFLSVEVITLGSIIDRHIRTQLFYNDNSITFKLKSPWITFDMDGALAKTDGMISLHAVADVNHIQKYSISFEMPIIKENNYDMYLPHIQIDVPRINNIDTITFSGNLSISNVEILVRADGNLMIGHRMGQETLFTAFELLPTVGDHFRIHSPSPQLEYSLSIKISLKTHTEQPLELIGFKSKLLHSDLETRADYQFSYWAWRIHVSSGEFCWYDKKIDLMIENGLFGVTLDYNDPYSVTSDISIRDTLDIHNQWTGRCPAINTCGFFFTSSWESERIDFLNGKIEMVFSSTEGLIVEAGWHVYKLKLEQSCNVDVVMSSTKKINCLMTLEFSSRRRLRELITLTYENEIHKSSSRVTDLKCILGIESSDYLRKKFQLQTEYGHSSWKHNLVLYFLQDGRITHQVELIKPFSQGYSNRVELYITEHVPYLVNLKCRRIKLVAGYEAEAAEFEVQGTINCDRKEISLRANQHGSKTRSHLGARLVVKDFFIPTMVIELGQHNFHREFRTNLNVNWDKYKTVHFHQTTNIELPGMVTVAMKLTSPFKGYEQVDLNSNLTNYIDTYNMSHQLAWGRNKQINLDGKITVKSPSWDGILRLNTPWDSFDRMIITTRNKNINGTWKSHIDLDYTGIDKVELYTEVELTNIKRIMIKFKCPPANLGTTEFQTHFIGNLANFTSGVELRNNRERNDILRFKVKIIGTDMSKSKVIFVYHIPPGVTDFRIKIQKSLKIN